MRPLPDARARAVRCAPIPCATADTGGAGRPPPPREAAGAMPGDPGARDGEAVGLALGTGAARGARLRRRAREPVRVRRSTRGDRESVAARSLESPVHPRLLAVPAARECVLRARLRALGAPPGRLPRDEPPVARLEHGA